MNTSIGFLNLGKFSLLVIKKMLLIKKTRYKVHPISFAYTYDHELVVRSHLSVYLFQIKKVISIQDTSLRKKDV
jgi:hypothetical protein